MNLRPLLENSMRLLRNSTLAPTRRPASQEPGALTRLAGELLPDVIAEGREHWASEPVMVDRGLVMVVAQFLLRLRREIEREMERDDLTPYMWSTMRNRYDALSKVFRMLERRADKDIEDWVVPEFGLLAEYDGDTIDFGEAADEAEADQLEQGYVDAGAVVTRYFIYPDFGQPVIAHYPILPFENSRRPMTQRQYEWVLRYKERAHLTLPEDPSQYLTKHGRSHDDEP